MKANAIQRCISLKKGSSVFACVCTENKILVCFYWSPVNSSQRINQTCMHLFHQVLVCFFDVFLIRTWSCSNHNKVILFSMDCLQILHLSVTFFSTVGHWLALSSGMWLGHNPNCINHNLKHSLLCCIQTHIWQHTMTSLFSPILAPCR